MAFAPPAVVEAPARQPLPFGLFSVLSPRPGDGGRWENGIQWESLGCTPVEGIGGFCATGEGGEPVDPIGLPKTFDPGGGVGEAEPFTVYSSYVCSPAGHPDPEDYAQGQALARLLSREEARVEQALWTGDLGNVGFAAGAVPADGTGAAAPLVEAVASLEWWLGAVYGSLGVIHMSRPAALLAIKQGVVERVGSSLQTVLGTPVVAGAGYPGTGPDGGDPGEGEAYLYATPALIGYRSEAFAGTSGPGGGFDPRRNDLYATAERTYVIGWDTCGTAYAVARTAAPAPDEPVDPGPTPTPDPDPEPEPEPEPEPSPPEPEPEPDPTDPDPTDPTDPGGDE